MTKDIRKKMQARGLHLKLNLSLLFSMMKNGAFNKA
jgi:hypothetical protein